MILNDQKFLIVKILLNLKTNLIFNIKIKIQYNKKYTLTIMFRKF